jgi:hypothetical protein
MFQFSLLGYDLGEIWRLSGSAQEQVAAGPTALVFVQEKFFLGTQIGGHCLPLLGPSTLNFLDFSVETGYVTRCGTDLLSPHHLPHNLPRPFQHRLSCCSQVWARRIKVFVFCFNQAF